MIPNEPDGWAYRGRAVRALAGALPLFEHTRVGAEPACSAVVQLTRASLARADRDAGRRNPLAAYAGPVRAGV